MTQEEIEAYNEAIEIAKAIVVRYRSYYDNDIPNVNFKKIMEALDKANPTKLTIYGTKWRE